MLCCVVWCCVVLCGVVTDLTMVAKLSSARIIGERVGC